MKLSPNYKISSFLGLKRCLSQIFVFILMSFMLSACAGGSGGGLLNSFSIGEPEKKDDGSSERSSKSAAQIYAEGQANINNGKIKKALKSFSEVERQYPYSKWARRAILMGSYLNYETNDYDKAILAAKRFLRLYPGNEDVDYAYYLIAVSKYEQIANVKRDQKQTYEAKLALTEVIKRFPNSKYSHDAKKKLRLANDHLAGKEMEVGRWYLRRHAYIASINRFRKVVEDYQTTSHAPEALLRLAEANMALGIKSEAQTAAAVLGHNFPNSSWYKSAYTLLKNDGLVPHEDKQSWLSKAWKQVKFF